MPYSVLIIGAGNIGAFFDTPQSSAVLTHAHAFTRHPGFRLAGFLDADGERSARAAALWGGSSFGSLAEAFGGGNVDVAVVAVPDGYHYQLLKELAGHAPRLVVAEKPLTTTLAEAEEVLRLYREKGISLAVNYGRRFVPGVAALRRQIAAGEFGSYLTGTGYYGKGMLHNGSHMVDLLRFLVGEIREVRPLAFINDCYPDDPSCTALLSFQDGAPFVMQAVDCRSFTVFEFDLFFERGRLRLTDAGARIESYQVRDNPQFAGYRNLALAGVEDSGSGDAFCAAAENYQDHLASGAALLCGGEDAYRAMQICLGARGDAS